MNIIKKLKENIIIFLKFIFSQPYFFILVILISFLLIFPSLDEGFFMDDLGQRLKATGELSVLEKNTFSVFGQFSFISGNQDEIQNFKDSGVLPWWSYDQLKLRFWRPVTELTHLFDYTFWQDKPYLMHLHSFFWYALLLLLLYFLYRRMMIKVWLPGFAILLFALDSCHVMPVTWLANRNSLIAVCFGLCTILVHDIWRRDNRIIGIILAPVLFSLSLLSTEYGIGTCAYLLAYELFISEKKYINRFLSLLPYGIITIIWRVIYHKLGYGAYGSGNYVDPGNEIFRFLFVLIERIPVFLNGVVGFPGADLYGFIPSRYKIFYWIFSVFILIILFIFTFPILKKSKTARFWGLGMLLCIIPISATVPDDRLLLFSGIGCMALLAEFITSWLNRAALYDGSKVFYKLSGIVVVLLIIVHMIIAPIEKVNNAVFYRNLRPIIDEPASDEILKPDSNKQTVIVINPPGCFLFFHYTIMKIYGKYHEFYKYRVLANANSRLKITRIDEYSIEIFAENGYYQNMWDRNFRDPDKLLPVNHQVRISGMNATVLSLTDNKIPSNVSFMFDKQLESSFYKFLYWNNNQYERFSLPEIGQTVYIDKFDLLDFFMHSSN